MECGNDAKFAHFEQILLVPNGNALSIFVKLERTVTHRLSLFLVGHDLHTAAVLHTNEIGLNNVAVDKKVHRDNLSGHGRFFPPGFRPGCLDYTDQAQRFKHKST